MAPTVSDLGGILDAACRRRGFLAVGPFRFIVRFFAVFPRSRYSTIVIHRTSGGVW